MIILRNKSFSIFKDKDKDGDYDLEDAKIQYNEWRQKRTGYPNVAGVGTVAGTALAAYGGSKYAEKREINKIADEVREASVKVAKEKAKASIGKKAKDGSIVTAEDVEKLFKDKKRAEKFIQKHGETERILRKFQKTADKRLKNAKTKGALVAGIPVLAGGLALTAYESNKRDKFLNNPKKLEVGYVKLVDKKKKKK